MAGKAVRDRTSTYIYRPQRSCGQGYVFSRVCDSVHSGGSASVHAGIPPLWEQTPPGSRHLPGSRYPPGAATPKAYTPQSRHPPRRRHHPPEQTPPRADTPRTRHSPRADTPPQKANSSIRSMSGRYTSYWNAFLFKHCY